MPSLRGQTVTRAPSSSSRASTTWSASTGTNTRRRRPPAAATTAAASAAFPQLAIARSRPRRWIGEPEPLRHLEPDQHAEEMPRLVRAGDVPRLVLHPDAAGRREAEPLAQLGAASERRRREAVTVDRCDTVVEPVHEHAELLVAHAAAGGGMVRVQQPPVAHERIRLRAVRRAAAASRDRARGGGRDRRRRRSMRSGSGTDTDRPAAGSAPQPAQTRRLTAPVLTASPALRCGR